MAAAAWRGDGSTLVAFYAGSIAALPEPPADSDARLYLQVFLIGAADSFWRRHGLPPTGAIPVLSELFERYGLPGNETAGLIEVLPQLRGDAITQRILQQGESVMMEFLGSHDPNLLLQVLDLVADGRRQHARPVRSLLLPAHT